MKVAVVGLGKIGLPLAVQFAGPGHHVDRRGRRRGRRPGRPRGRAAVPRRGRARRAAGRRGRRRARWRRPRTPRRRSSASDVVVVVVPLYVDADGDARLLGDRRRHRGRRGRACGRARSSSYETTLPVGTTRNRLGAAAGAAQRPARRRRPVPRVQPRAGLLRAGLRRPRALPEAGRRGRPGERRGAPWTSTRAGLRFDERPGPGPAERCLGPGLGRGRRARQAGRDDLPGRQHRAGQPVRAARRPHRRRRPPGRSRPATRSRSATCTRPGIAVGGHCIPVYPWFYLAGDPDATIVRAARDRQQRDARAGGASCSPRRTATCTARPWSCSAPATAAGSRRPRSPGVFATVDALRGAGRGRARARPAVHAGRARRPRARAVRAGQARRRRGAAGRPRRVPHASPAADLPGVRVRPRRPGAARSRALARRHDRLRVGRGAADPAGHRYCS